jgi:hypothetical protein
MFNCGSPAKPENPMSSSSLAKYCIIIAVGLLVMSVGLVFAYDLSWWFIGLAGLLFVPVAMGLGFMAGFMIDKNETVPVAQVWTDETEILITSHSDEIVGIFQGTEIYEWVVLKKPDGSGEVTCKYLRTFNLDKGEEFLPPENVWFCLLPPGILYAADPEPELEAPEAE